MRSFRNVSFVLLVAIFYFTGAPAALDEPSCFSPTEGPHWNPTMGWEWCLGDDDYVFCEDEVLACCGEDFDGDCVIEGCGIILPGGAACACGLSIHCEEPVPHD